ncbi:MAG TPA: glycosyltransferase family 2 protein [Candidatus Saccharimonadales bacterium]|nr:glycosyltransferase family 2 protein [Candidatus Saccharimonadales bacterium]
MIIEQLFIASLTVGILTAILNIIGVSVYDLSAAKRLNQLKLHPYTRLFRHRPLISIVIISQNNQQFITHCLMTILKSTYRKIEILIIDNASTDESREMILKFQLEHPKKSIRLVSRVHTAHNRSIINRNIKRYTSGELILEMTANQYLHENALRNAVNHFNGNPNINLLGLNFRTTAAYSTIGILQKYRELLEYRTRKCLNVFRIGLETNTFNGFYRRNPSKTTINNSYYANDVVIFRSPPKSYYGLAKLAYLHQLYRLQTLIPIDFCKHDGSKTKVKTTFGILFVLTTLCMPLIVSYFIFMAVELREPAYLIFSWVILAAIILFTIWTDEYLKITQRLSFSVLLPLSYLMFFVLSFLQYVAIAGRLFGKMAGNLVSVKN